MSESVKSFLSLIKLTELDNWSISHLIRKDFIFNDKFQVIKLNSVLSKANIEWVEIQDDKKYPILGVRSQGQGVYLNRIALGKELTMKKYQKSKLNHLFYCKVRTVKGQWGIVDSEYENTYASSNMQYLKIDLDILVPKYLELLLKIKSLTDTWDQYAIGADGRHFNLNTLLNIKIPLPTIEEQNKLLEKYNAKIALAQSLEKEAKEIEQSIEEYLFEELGIEKIEEKEKSSKLQFIESKNLDRWDTLYLIGNIPTLKSKYKIVKFSKIITYFNTNNNGESLRINSKDYPNKSFIYIGMEHIEKETGALLEINNVKGKEIKSQTLKVPSEYILYGKLRPYLNKYWINNLDKNNIICSSEFFVFDIEKSINKLFFKYCLSSNFIQMQITDKTSGARMPRINEDTFMSLDTPLPPIDIQDKIATEITKRKEKIKQLKQQALNNREDAIKEFEEEIFAK